MQHQATNFFHEVASMPRWVQSSLGMLPCDLMDKGSRGMIVLSLRIHTPHGCKVGKGPFEIFTSFYLWDN